MCVHARFASVSLAGDASRVSKPYMCMCMCICVYMCATNTSYMCMCEYVHVYAGVCSKQVIPVHV